MPRFRVRTRKWIELEAPLCRLRDTIAASESIDSLPWARSVNIIQTKPSQRTSSAFDSRTSEDLVANLRPPRGWPTNLAFQFGQILRVRGTLNVSRMSFFLGYTPTRQSELFCLQVCAWARYASSRYIRILFDSLTSASFVVTLPLHESESGPFRFPSGMISECSANSS